MRLGDIVLENERQGKNSKNEKLISLKLKELVFAYPIEVLEVLHKTGIKVETELPSNVILAIVGFIVYKRKMNAS